MSESPRLELVSTAESMDPQAWYGDASHFVARFLFRLRGVPADQWLDACRSPLVECRDDVLFEEQADVVARHRLHDAIDSMPAVASRIRARVDDTVSVYRGILPDTDLHRMRRSACVAACAVAAYARLSYQDRARLYRPFLDLIPLPAEILPHAESSLHPAS